MAEPSHGSGLNAISGYDLLRLDFDVYICPDGGFRQDLVNDGATLVYRTS